MNNEINITTEEFIRAFHGTGTVCMRAFPDREAGKSAVKVEATPETLDGALTKLHRLNDEYYGVSFVVNGGGHTNRSITKITAQFMECDDLSIEEQKAQIAKFPLPPSIIVQTRKSLHTYWLIRDGDVKQFRKIQLALVNHFHGDSSCVSESKILRLPGFYHCKKEPLMVRCIEFHPERVYTQEQLYDVIPRKMTAKEKKQVHINGKSDKIASECDFISYCRDNAKTLSEPLWHAMITNLAGAEGGSELIHQLSKPYDDYTVDATDRKIQAFIDSGYFPTNCRTIDVLGYHCPRLGQCRVKCPAQLGQQVDEIANMPWYHWEINRNGSRSLRFSQGELADWLKENEDGFFLNGMFYYYEDGVYREHDRDFAMAVIRSHLITKSATKAQITDTLAQWKMIAVRTEEDINPNPMIVNMKNGLYDIERDVLLSHTPDYLSTIQLNIDCNPKADCPKFRKFLKDLFNEEYHSFVQEMLGYMLVPVTKAQKAFIISGQAAAGKSKFLSVIEEILIGRNHVSNVTWQKLNSRFMTSQLHNKLANIFADLPSVSIDDTGLFKSLVGEDEITVENKFEHPFSFRNKARLIFSCNQIPSNYSDRTNGFYRRLCILHCNPPLPEEQRNPDLLEELREEGSGIFNYALEGLRRLMARSWHFDEPKIMKANLEEYKAQNHSVLLFLRECCELESDASVTSQDLYDAYTAFCEDENAKPFARNKFGKEILNACPDLTNTRDWKTTLRIWHGIKLNDIR